MSSTARKDGAYRGRRSGRADRRLRRAASWRASARSRQANPRHVILRTSWVYGVYGQNFLKTMLRLAPSSDELRVVDDQRGCPTATADLAQAILRICRLCAQSAPWGTYHFAGHGRDKLAWLRRAHRRGAGALSGKRPKVTAMTRREYPTPARRPRNSALDSARFAATSA